jgi:hypothetical protein
MLSRKFFASSDYSWHDLHPNFGTVPVVKIILNAWLGGKGLRSPTIRRESVALLVTWPDTKTCSLKWRDRVISRSRAKRGLSVWYRSGD